MPISPLPTVAEVKAEAKLIKTQVSATFSDNGYNDDVARRIGEEAAFVEVKLTSRFTLTDLANLTSTEKVLATLTVKFRAAASLYHTAGQLNEKYKGEALDYERRAGEAMELLLTSIDSRFNTPATGSKHGTMLTGRGIYRPTDAETRASIFNGIGLSGSINQGDGYGGY